jgi:hypothetical protein
VTVEKIADAAEGGTAGVFRVTRDGDLSQDLAVTVTVGGTATDGDDYASMGTTITFLILANEASADVPVDALHDGVSDPDETVTLTIEADPAYTVGTQYTASLDVIDTDTPPAAFDGLATASVNGSVTVAVLDLATDLDGDALTVTAVSQGADGGVVLNLDGTVTYTPDTGFSGDDEFTYTVEDAFGNTATGTILVAVTRPQAPPTSVWTAAGTAVTIDVPALAFDPDGDTLFTAGATNGDYGTVVVNTDGTVTYTPNTGFTGDDSFEYTVEDPDGNQATHTITVTVGPTDPVALDDAAVTPVDTAVTVAVLDLAYQPAGGSLAVTAVTQGNNGSVAINLDGTVTYTPNASYSGTDSFTYTVTDGSSRTGTGTITVNVGPEPEGSADGIMSVLSDVQDDVDDYGEGTPDALLAALPGLADEADDYLEDVTTFVSTNNVNVIGANKSYKDFLEVVNPIAKMGLYQLYIDLTNTEALLWALCLSTRDLVRAVDAQIAAEKAAAVPRPAILTALTTARTKLMNVHLAVQKTWTRIYGQHIMTAGRLVKAYGAIQQASPSVFESLPDYPNPTIRNFGDLNP